MEVCNAYQIIPDGLLLPSDRLLDLQEKDLENTRCKLAWGINLEMCENFLN